MGVTFGPRTRIKKQVLSDFIMEFTPRPPRQSNLLKGWVLNVDCTSNGRGAEFGIILTPPKGPIIEQSYTLRFCATNNEVEYEAVIMGLKIETTIGIQELEVRCDSLLIVSQVNREYTVKDDRMAAYLKIVTT